MMRLSRLFAMSLATVVLVGSSALQTPASLRATPSAAWTWQNPLPQGTQLVGISCGDTNTCLAVGDLGAIVGTTDGGADWTQLSVGTTSDLKAVSCPTTSVCFVISNQGAILKTVDDGATWTTQTSGIPFGLEGISCATATVCFAVSAGGDVTSTSDGGTTWTSKIPNAAYGLDAVTCASTTMCVAVGYPESILVTSDGGGTWTGQSLSTTDTLMSVSCPTTSVCFAASNNGSIVRSVDGAATWSLSDSTTFTWSTITCANSSTCFAAGIFAVVRQTSDGGLTWSNKPADYPFWLFAGSCPSSNVCFLAGQNGDVVATTDGGSTWTRQISVGNRFMVFALGCGSPLTCTASIDDAKGTMLTTLNGGDTWTTTSAGGWTFTGFSCPSAAVCYASAPAGGTGKSTNYGENWTVVQTATASQLNGISCASVSSCVAVGDSGVVVTTNNAGVSWVVRSSGTTQSLHGVSCVTIAQCVAVGDAGVILATGNGGMSWTAETSGTTALVSSVACPTISNCYAGTWNGTVIGTSNGGATWTTRYSPPVCTVGICIIPDISGVACTGPTTCTAAGGGHSFGPVSILVSTTDGTTWTAIPLTSDGFTGVACPAPATCFAYGWSGAILASATPQFCSAATMTSDKSSPQSDGTTVTFSTTATGNGCTAAEYEYWLWSPATGWVMRQPYSTNPNFVLDTTGMAPGTYTVDAWVEQSGSPIGSANYETFALNAWVVGGCDFASVTPNPAPMSGLVTFTATAGGAGCGTPLYQWWVYTIAGGWQLKQLYGTSNTWQVNADSLAAGTYSIDVWVKQQGSPLPYETWALSTIPKGACGNNGSTTITPTQASPQAAGTTINLSTASTCGGTPFFRYWTFPGQHNSWQLLRDYSSIGAFAWNTTGWKPGTQSIDVHVTSGPAVSGASPDTWGLLSYSLTGCTTAGIGSSPATPAVLRAVVLTATANGCPSPLYQFWVYPPGGPWTMVQDFSPAATFNWRPQQRGTYAWVVYVKESGAGNTFDTFGLSSVTVG